MCVCVCVLMCLHMCGFVCMCTNPSERVGRDARLIFNQSLTDLNSVFSFSTGCHVKRKQPSAGFEPRVVVYMPNDDNHYNMM